MTARFVTVTVLVETAWTTSTAGEFLRPTRILRNTRNTLTDIELAQHFGEAQAVRWSCCSRLHEPLSYVMSRCPSVLADLPRSSCHAQSGIVTSILKNKGGDGVRAGHERERPACFRTT